MEEHKIIPDILEAYPEQILSVKYNENDEVELGNILTPSQVKNKPQIKWDADPNLYYTLVMVDLDAPTRNKPIFREIRHWLVINIKGSDFKSGEHVTEYLGSAPPQETGLHRYVFLLYKHGNKIYFNEPRIDVFSRCNRLRFDCQGFARKYRLGKPIAANFYRAEWDSYVNKRDENNSKCGIL